ncbi:hypothetical protein Ato02nite_097330 [Paractinoplanes toevensis]|uniref:Uncharacterized protein n=1 Tax=Paractinoplanes toevensis TaxID=571911 RepID=A0A919WCY5_9ACTN|nr:hypothetical protein [Actinoplanes toevensis]GIM97940.1 hypothetical protein Ato02nite_097330 [Actinoplanes toevensis]
MAGHHRLPDRNLIENLAGCALAGVTAPGRRARAFVVAAGPFVGAFRGGLFAVGGRPPLVVDLHCHAEPVVARRAFAAASIRARWASWSRLPRM